MFGLFGLFSFEGSVEVRPDQSESWYIYNNNLTNLIREAAGDNNTEDLIHLIANTTNEQRQEVINDCDNHGFTPLLLASSHGGAECVKILISHGANVNSKGANGRSSIIYAACNGNIDILQKLLDAGAYINDPDDSGMTALMYAADHGFSECVLLLLGYVSTLVSIV
jgi:ankyrin repeat protein